MSKPKNSLLEELVRTGLAEDNRTDYLEQCMSFDIHLDRKVPLRYRLIALGFIRHYTLDALNEKLLANGCAALYSRNYQEAGLIYAFLRGLSFEEWKGLEEKSRRVMEEHAPLSPWLQKGKITADELRRYVEENSADADSAGTLKTRHRTRELDAALKSPDTDFTSFLLENIDAFSLSREKTRYYFCKYLWYFLDTKIKEYVAEMKTGRRKNEAPAVFGDDFDTMNVFEGIVTQRRKKGTPEEMQDFLMHAGISCGNLYADYNQFYHGYVTLDWMDILLERYGEISRVPAEEKHFLAESLRRYNPKFRKLDDNEVLAQEDALRREEEKNLDEAYRPDKGNRGYQRGRQGENSIRKYIRGQLDIDRTSLIFYLLYFGASAELPPEYRISERRLSGILRESGYAPLNPDEDLDLFAIQFIAADDQFEFLVREVNAYAVNWENFFLYRSYLRSRSESETMKKLLGE